MATLPAFIVLGRIEGTPAGVGMRFCGHNITGALQLPAHLFGCRLDSSSFRLTKEGSILKSFLGQARQSWSCRWQGAREDTFTELTWDSERGWIMHICWFGEDMVCGLGNSAVPFEAFFQNAVPDFSDIVEKNPAGLDIMTLKTPKDFPKAAGLPDGVLMTVVLPFHTSLIAEVVERWEALRSRRGAFLCAATAAVFLHQTVKHTRRGVSFLRLAKDNMRETGIFCPDLPVIDEKTGEERVFRYVYALHVTTAYHEIPAVLDWFGPLLDRNPKDIGRGFQCAAHLLPLVKVVREHGEGFCIVWQRLPDPLAALGAAPADSGKIKAALRDLKDALDDSRNIYAYLFEDDLYPDADNSVLVKTKAHEDDTIDNENNDEDEDVEKQAPSPFGVPLAEVARSFRDTDGCSARFEGRRLIVCGDDEKANTVIEVLPPPRSVSPDISAIIQVRTLVQQAKDKGGFSVSMQGTLNALAAGGSLIKLWDGRQAVVSRITWYRRDNAWEDVQRVLVGLAAFQGATPQIRGSAVELGIREPRFTGDSAWNDCDFKSLESLMSKHMFCNASDTGFTAEVVLEGSGITMADGSLTALIQMSAASHPYLGPGLLCRLSMPNAFASQECCAETAADLNRLEYEGWDEAYHFGAWCTNDGQTLSYVSFFPNHTKGNNSLMMNWPFVLGARAKWAHSVLKRPTGGV